MNPMNMNTVLATWFAWFETEVNSIHHGTKLPDYGKAVDEEGRIYVQNVTDIFYWTWKWEPTGEVVKVPKALRNTLKDVRNAIKGYTKAYEAWRRGERGAWKRMEHLRELWDNLEKKAGRIAHEKGLI